MPKVAGVVVSEHYHVIHTIIYRCDLDVVEDKRVDRRSAMNREIVQKRYFPPPTVEGQWMQEQLNVQCRRRGLFT